MEGRALTRTMKLRLRQGLKRTDTLINCGRFLWFDFSDIKSSKR